MSRQAVPSEGRSGRCRAPWWCVNAVPSGTSILVVCLSGSPRWASCVCEETFVSVASWPVCFPGRGGLIAVGQRLAPMSTARTNCLKEETFVNFSLVGDVFGRHTSCGHWGDPSEHDVDARRLRGAPTSIRQGQSPSIDVSRSLSFFGAHRVVRPPEHGPAKPVWWVPMVVGFAMFKRDGKSRR